MHIQESSGWGRTLVFCTMPVTLGLWAAWESGKATPGWSGKVAQARAKVVPASRERKACSGTNLSASDLQFNNKKANDLL